MTQVGFDVCIVSAYGRGNYVAAALKDKGLYVNLIDVTSQMGRWAPEDWEGPFGYFQADGVSPLWTERLDEQDDSDPIDGGFSVWLKNGPIDFKGPLSAHVLEKLGLKSICEKYLLDTSSSKKELDYNQLENAPFAKSWIVKLAYSLAANHYAVEKSKIDSSSKPLPLFANWQVRRGSRKGYDKSLEWCEARGIIVKRDSFLKDVNVQNRRCVGVEIESSSLGVVTANQFVWMLTGEETARFPKSVHQSLFPQTNLECVWSWLRYRVTFNDDYILQTLPIKFVVLEDIHLPHAHENLLVVERCSNDKDFDVWLRIPTQHRFQKTYLNDIGEKVIELLKRKIPQAKPVILDMPQDFKYDAKELGPSPFPVYDSQKLRDYKLTSFKNLIFQSPEVWCPQDLSGQFAHHENVIAEVSQRHFKMLKGQPTREAEL